MAQGLHEKKATMQIPIVQIRYENMFEVFPSSVQ